MDEENNLAEQFQAHRTRLRSLAYRMLGSVDDAEDVVQEGWLRLSVSNPQEIENLGGWLTTVVARMCLDKLRVRKSRLEERLDEAVSDKYLSTETGDDPEQDALLADSVSLALLVVLHTLGPAERVAFVLHDMFDLPFDEIGPIVGRSVEATRKLASRARLRVRRPVQIESADRVRERNVVGAFLAAVRSGDFDALLAILDPEVLLTADQAAVPPGASRTLRGALAVARGARGAAANARTAQVAMVDGTIGVIVAPRGRLRIALKFSIVGQKIISIDVLADPARLRRLHLASVES